MIHNHRATGEWPFYTQPKIVAWPAQLQKKWPLHSWSPPCYFTSKFQDCNLQKYNGNSFLKSGGAGIVFQSKKFSSCYSKELVGELRSTLNFVSSLTWYIYVIVATFLMKPLMNKSTSTTIDVEWNFDKSMPIIETKFDISYIYYFLIKYYHEWLTFGWKIT